MRFCAYAVTELLLQSWQPPATMPQREHVSSYLVLASTVPETSIANELTLVTQDHAQKHPHASTAHSARRRIRSIHRQRLT